MNEANQSLVLRWARWQMRTLARLWPEESRTWGEAIASEAEEIDQPLQALGWALGGVTVYLRALGTHLLEWFKLPVGQRSGATAPVPGEPGPKRSRIFTAVVLACASGLLCLPEGREAIRTVKSTWENYAEMDTSQRELRKLAVQAEKENDAEAMAFAALGMQDEKRAMDWANRAVKLDPRLFWIYEAKSLWPNDSPTAQNWTTKAQAADPQNAVPYLRAASLIVNKTYMEMEQRRSPKENEVQQALMGNPQWVALMDKAFRAPAYNSFYREDQELSRAVWRRNPQLSMATVLPVLWRHAIPDFESLKWFTKALVKRSEEEQATGHHERAQELLSEAQGLGKRMEEDSVRADWSAGFGLSLERESALGWKAFYEATGNKPKAQEAAEQVAQTEQRGAAVVREMQQRWRQRDRMEGSGWAVQLSALLIVLAALVAAFGIGLFEIRPAVARHAAGARRLLSSLADFGPVVVLLASTAFVVSFIPYARAMAAFREGNGGRADVVQLSRAFWSLHAVTWRMAGPDTAVLGWTVLTVVLSLTAALILARMVYRATRTTETHA